MFQGQSRDSIAADDQSCPQPTQNSGQDLLNREETLARQAKGMFMSRFSEEQLALPHFQKIVDAMDSPEFVELLRSDDFSASKQEGFWKSKGFPVIDEHPELFTDQPPLRRQMRCSYMPMKSLIVSPFTIKWASSGGNTLNDRITPLTAQSLLVDGCGRGIPVPIY